MSKGWLLFAIVLFAAPAVAEESMSTEPPASPVSEPVAVAADADVADAVMAETETVAEAEEAEEDIWEASCGIGGSMSGGNVRFGSVAGDCRIAREAGRVRIQLDGAGHFGRTRYGGIGRYASGLPITGGSFIVTQKDYMAALREEYYAREDRRTFFFAV